ncbi:chitinase [Pseudoxanthomonas sp. GM95]|uniref:glycoside hydrolase family 18 protein n=1 Tax=Pseudoxanthomonas sp. GM95 TaxID=1881043 RepID=UPI0008C1C48D|nr:glycoside hydrolase family 18 protein [Pseudoxanthomonas sp. GM95]SEM46962.1 chitinase [Pseudoxanthomonas sp. GM95]
MNVLRLILSAAVLSLGACASAGQPLADPPPPPALKLIGYVTNGSSLPPISARKLDVINFAFAVVNPQHRVYLPDADGPRTLDGLVKLRKDNPELKIVLSIGGWSAGNFSEAAATPEARTAFTDSAMALLRAHDLDGLDIDWEYPTLDDAGISASPDDKANFTALLSQLRTALDAEGTTSHRQYLLSIAAAEGRFASGLDLPRIAPLLDWINLMTYDFHGSLTPTTGHAAGLGASKLDPDHARNGIAAAQYFLDAGVPAKKINLGMAFYGRRFGDVTDAQHGLYQRFDSDGGFISYGEIVQGGLLQHGFTRYWDADAQSAWLWNPTTRQMISYDDPQALQAKVRFVREHGLGGVMYWEYRQDDGEALLDVVREAIDAGP